MVFLTLFLLKIKYSKNYDLVSFAFIRRYRFSSNLTLPLLGVTDRY